MKTLTLAELVAPTTLDDFIESVMGRSMLHTTGKADRFTHLFSWTRLNEVLSSGRLDYPRLRLAKAKTLVPRESYLTDDKYGATTLPRLLVPRLIEELGAGATLVVDFVNELSEPLAQLCAELQSLFRTRVSTNSYVAFRSVQGFDVHYDDHDVFVLQLYGHKDWAVFGETTPNPHKSGVPGFEAARPGGEPLWKRRLGPGDVLYLPRGWWHYAVACEEPSLHLTVGLTIPTFVDLWRWAEGELFRASSEVRARLPLHASSPDQRAALEKISLIAGSYLNELLMKEGSLEEFLTQRDVRRPVRVQADLPSAVTHGPGEATEGGALRSGGVLPSTPTIAAVPADGVGDAVGAASVLAASLRRSMSGLFKRSTSSHLRQ